MPAGHHRAEPLADIALLESGSIGELLDSSPDPAQRRRTARCGGRCRSCSSASSRHRSTRADPRTAPSRSGRTLRSRSCGPPWSQISSVSILGEAVGGIRETTSPNRRNGSRPSRAVPGCVRRSLASSDDTWASTVRTETYSRAAISAFGRPSPSRRSTSDSREVTPAVGELVGTGAWARRRRGTRRRPRPRSARRTRSASSVAPPLS